MNGLLQHAPAERAARGLQLAAVYNGGPPALMRVPAVLTMLPALPGSLVGGPRCDIVRRLRPVLLGVPFLNEIWPLLCDSAPPSTLLPVICTGRNLMVLHVYKNRVRGWPSVVLSDIILAPATCNLFSPCSPPFKARII